MALTPQLVEAYEQALYVLEAGAVLRVGSRNAELDRLLEAHGVKSAAFVTAANPRGEPQSEAANAAATAALRAALAFASLEGEGRDPQGRWTPERSVLVLGIAREEAAALGRRFEQNAIVYVEKGAAAELLLLRKMRLVLDTQVWLDWLVFEDPSVAGLRAWIASGDAEVLIDAACFAELERVLAYRLGKRAVDAAACLDACRRETTRVDIGSGPLYELPQCRDPDDQKFLTLAAGARADCLVTRDRALLRLTRRSAPWFAIVPPDAFRLPRFRVT